MDTQAGWAQIKLRSEVVRKQEQEPKTARDPDVCSGQAPAGVRLSQSSLLQLKLRSTSSNLACSATKATRGLFGKPFSIVVDRQSETEFGTLLKHKYCNLEDKPPRLLSTYYPLRLSAWIPPAAAPHAFSDAIYPRTGNGLQSVNLILPIITADNFHGTGAEISPETVRSRLGAALQKIIGQRPHLTQTFSDSGILSSMSGWHSLRTLAVPSHRSIHCAHSTARCKHTTHTVLQNNAAQAPNCPPFTLSRHQAPVAAARCLSLLTHTWPVATLADSSLDTLPAMDSDAAFEAYATAITAELRAWVRVWLAGVRATWDLHAALHLPLPHPAHPLPQTFPFGAQAEWQVFEWVHAYGTEQLRHCYAVSLAFCGRTGTASVVWKIMSGGVELGVFEVAGPIYDARAQLPFVLGADLVVEALLASLATHRPVHLASHVIRGGGDVSAIQVFTLRMPGITEEIIRILGARWVT
ncbi:hypothetical protein GGX14DRAFT_609492 [Mycena pura]|uniref:Uncharacterized protein n=1 Tax=Mycena pura TaxID=153505 RepID=A0AAD6YHW1_9AGAR|nr:hypothetical protein GGX14DRAFT_609492 [Mycena pura]